MFFSFSTNHTAFFSLVSSLCLVGLSLPVYAESPVSDTPIVLAESPVSSAPTIDSPVALESASEQWSVHGQATYINQFKNNFNSPYYGSKSLLNKSDGDISKSYTFSATAFLGTRLWEGAEAYINPEMFEGIPFSGLSGLGGFSNGELQKGTAIPPIYYMARMFLRQTFGFGGGQEHIEGVANQLAGNVDKRRLVVTYGTFSALDFFDANAYSHDPRTQFLNWSLMASGAYDYAANSRGYTYGFVGEYYHDEEWVMRLARLAMPKSPNSLALDYDLTQQYGNTAEITHLHTINGQAGKARVLVFQNRGIMSTYNNAMNFGQQSNTTPDILSTRYGYQTKWGYALNGEQAITENIGAFGRWSWNNGQTETQAFTDISNSLSGGLSIKGTGWGRPQDTIGIGAALNGISSQQISYLQKGGVTMFIGDGRLNYKKEQIFETLYSWNVYKSLSLSADYQRIANPGYNTDRGPVNFYGLRAHIEM
ncbi:carbohydrate porin [Polynucleobacter paneuropaeus]|nr:carbohydrate porin [Polynucleobacter paneuropaeus]